MKLFAILALSAMAAGSLICLAGDAKVNPFKATLQTVPAAELPAKSAKIVSEAKPAHRKTTTVDVVTAGVEINPASAPVIVGAIAHAVPDMAAEAAGVAAAAQPNMAAAIARAAAGGAPAHAGKIVFAVCKVVPNQYRAIAVAVAEVVPDSGRDVLENVGLAIPQLKSSIQSALAGYSGTPAAVGAALDRATISTLTIARKSGDAPSQTFPSVARGPAVGPPYIPLSGTPTNVTPGTGGDVPPGGRNYAAP